MSLKQIIRRNKILASGVLEKPFTIPGEPMIYSLKYNIGGRIDGLNVFRNMQWKSMLKCFFCSQYKTSIPVVLIVRFYCTPPSRVSVDRRKLLSEKMPATHSHELCDYVLSFIEMLHHVLINSYRQIVKLDLEKYYSLNPRTVFQFMKWAEYDELQNSHSNDTESKGLSAPRQDGDVQPECQGDAGDEKVCSESTCGEKASVVEGPSVDCGSVQDTSTPEPARKKTKTAKLPTSYKKA